VDQGHEVPVHGELNSISGGFSGRACSASKHKKYTREVIIVEVWEANQPVEPDRCFTSADLGDVVPHEDDPVVISVVPWEEEYIEFLLTRGAQLM